MRQTTMAKPADVTRTWYVVDGKRTNFRTFGFNLCSCIKR